MKSDPDLVPLDLVSCDMATTNLTLPWFPPLLNGRETVWRKPPTIFYRQQAEIFGQGYDRTFSIRNILN